MARPLKIGADYFPLNVNFDGKFERIEAKYGNDGFAAIIKLYQEIYKEGYYLTLDDDSIFVYSKRFGIEYNKLDSIINDCLKYSLFDISLKEKYGILTSSGIQKRYFKIMERRKSITVISEYMLIDFAEIFDKETSKKIIYVSLNNIQIDEENVNANINADLKGVNVNINDDSSELMPTLSTQIKLNKIKLNKTKELINTCAKNFENSDTEIVSSDNIENAVIEPESFNSEVSISEKNIDSDIFIENTEPEVLKIFPDYKFNLSESEIELLQNEFYLLNIPEQIIKAQSTAISQKTFFDSKDKLLKYLRIKLQVAEKPLLEANLTESFEQFWELYDKKVDVKICRTLWWKLKPDEITAILEHVPKYVLSTPDKTKRKHPQTYLRNESWNNEIVVYNQNNGIVKNGTQITNGTHPKYESLTPYQRRGAGTVEQVINGVEDMRKTGY